MKTCTICNQSKELTEFSKLSRSKDGRYPQCKICKGLKDKEFYNNNKDIILEKSAKRYETCKPILNEDQRIKKNETSKKWRQEHSEFVREYNIYYKDKHEDIIKEQRREYRLNNKPLINESARKLRKKDPLYSIKKNLRNRVGEVLNNKGFDKDLSLSEYLGCDYKTLIEYIESQFYPGISWENRSEWHIDHKLPISNAINKKQLYELSYYLNLRPLLSSDNIRKSDKASICWQKLRRDRLINEDKKAGYNFDLKVKDFIFSEEEYTIEHGEFIKKYEWLGTIGYSPKHIFTARYNNQLAGVVIIADPITNQFGDKEALIARGACSSWAPKHLNSSLVMFSCRWMIKHTDKRIFTAYSDPRAGEIGTIYQACNFDYLGDKFGAKRLFTLPDGREVSSRYFTTMFCLKKWAKALNIKWDKSWNKVNGYHDKDMIPENIYKQLVDFGNKFKKSCKKSKADRKGKYVLLLNYGHDKIQKTWECKPYPKRVK